MKNPHINLYSIHQKSFDRGFKMEDIIAKAFHDSLKKMLRGINSENYRHINESVFRYFFIKSLPKEVNAEDEWRRIDLVLHDDSGIYPIEFKQYDTRTLKNFNGKDGFKGGAGKGNFNEFIYSSVKLVDLLREQPYIDKGCKFKRGYFILLAGDNHTMKKAKFSDYYKGEHIKKLKREGIKVKKITDFKLIQKEFEIFGWVLRLW